MINRGWNNVFKKSDSNSNTDESQMRNLGILTKSFVYWLASRNVSDDMTTPTDNQGGIEFNTKKVGSGNNLYFTIWYSGGTGMLSFDSINASNGLRPVFHLSENTVVVSGNGTKDKPYNLGLQ